VRPSPTDDDVELARRAVTRVKGDDSELAELWAESDSALEWRGHVDDLLKRLGA
jgi:hypothetical protein